MSAMLRLFVAILLPDEARERAARVQNHLRGAMGEDGLRWVAPAQFHFTLKFLGDMPADTLPGIEEAIARAVERVTPFALSMAGVGVFPAQRSPQVLWIGATEGVPVLTQAAEWMDQELASVDVPAETKPYRAHVTLARMKTREGEEMVAKTLPTLRDDPELCGEFARFEVRECALMQSEMRAGGAQYSVLKTFALGARSEYNR